jgi:hypothetical protein
MQLTFYMFSLYLDDLIEPRHLMHETSVIMMRSAEGPVAKTFLRLMDNLQSFGLGSRLPSG